MLSCRQFNGHDIYITSRYPMDVPVVSMEIYKISTRVSVLSTGAMRFRGFAIWISSVPKFTSQNIINLTQLSWDFLMKNM